MARAGATAEYVRGRLAVRLAGLPDEECPDIIVVVVGVNDLIRYRTLRDWRRDVNNLLADLPNRAKAQMLVCGMPQFGHFKAFPQPLRSVFARRAKVMDNVLAKAAEAIDARHVPMPGEQIFSHGDSFFAHDLFHPSIDGYSQLASVLAPVAAELTSSMPTSTGTRSKG